MKSTKASLFFAYCLLALMAVGSAFSHFWRVKKDLSADLKQASRLSS